MVTNTLYLCAPAHDQRRLTPLFVSVMRQIIEHVYDHVTRGRRPLDPPLLVVLDEAANIAPLSDLDALAATAAGHGIQLVTVWHDLAQINARYGSGPPRWSTTTAPSCSCRESRTPRRSTTPVISSATRRSLLPAVTRRSVVVRWPEHNPFAIGPSRLAPRCAAPNPPREMAVLLYGDLPPARLQLRTGFDR